MFSSLLLCSKNILYNGGSRICQTGAPNLRLRCQSIIPPPPPRIAGSANILRVHKHNKTSFMVKSICVQYCKLAYRYKMQIPPPPQVHDTPPPYLIWACITYISHNLLDFRLNLVNYGKSMGCMPI